MTPHPATLNGSPHLTPICKDLDRLRMREGSAEKKYLQVTLGVFQVHARHPRTFACAGETSSRVKAPDLYL